MGYKIEEDSGRMLKEPDVAAVYGKTRTNRIRSAHSKQVVSERENLSPYTMEEIRESIRRSEADVAVGRVVSNERVFAELEMKYPFLCR